MSKRNQSYHDEFQHLEYGSTPTATDIPRSLQEELLTLLIFDDERAPTIRHRVPAASFEGAYGEIARAVYGYVDKHDKAPGPHLDTLLGKKLEKSERLQRVLRMLKRAYKTPNLNPDFTMTKLNEFVEHQRLRIATREILGEFNTGNASVAKVRTIMQDALDKTSQPYGGRLASSVTPRNPQFLWHPYLVAGEINIIGGKGNVGKGVMLSSITSTVVRGVAWPDKSGRAPKGHVLWAEMEDDLSTTIIPRLMGHDLTGRALDNVTVVDSDEFARLDLAQTIRDKGVRLIVLSPLNSFLPNIKNTNDEIAVRAALGRIHKAVQGTSCAVAAIMHLNKKTDLDSMERLLGSGAFANFSRSVLLLNQDKESETLRRVVHAKHNLSAKGRDLLFDIANADNERSQYLYTTWHLVPNGQDVNVDTFLGGSTSSARAKLSEADKKAIRDRWEAGDGARAISDDYPVSKRRINQLASEERWKKPLIED